MNKEKIRQHISISPQEKILLIKKMGKFPKNTYKSWSYIFFNTPLLENSGWIIITQQRVILIDPQYIKLLDIPLQDIQKIKTDAKNISKDIFHQQQKAFIHNLWKRMLLAAPFFILFIMFPEEISVFLRSPYFFFLFLLIGVLSIFYKDHINIPLFPRKITFVSNTGKETSSDIIDSRTEKKIQRIIHQYSQKESLLKNPSNTSWGKYIFFLILICLIVIGGSIIIAFYTS